MTSPLPDFVRRIISGGQTGVDRGALDAAIAWGVEHGGWCPKGRLAEDGRIPACYTLQETDSSDYRQPRSQCRRFGRYVDPLSTAASGRHRADPPDGAPAPQAVPAGRPGRGVRRTASQGLDPAASNSGLERGRAPREFRAGHRPRSGAGPHGPAEARTKVDERPAVGEYENTATPKAGEGR